MLCAVTIMRRSPRLSHSSYASLWSSPSPCGALGAACTSVATPGATTVPSAELLAEKRTLPLISRMRTVAPATGWPSDSRTTQSSDEASPTLANKPRSVTLARTRRGRSRASGFSSRESSSSRYTPPGAGPACGAAAGASLSAAADSAAGLPCPAGAGGDDDSPQTEASARLSSCHLFFTDPVVLMRR